MTTLARRNKTKRIKQWKKNGWTHYGRLFIRLTSAIDYQHLVRIRWLGIWTAFPDTILP